MNLQKLSDHCTNLENVILWGGMLCSCLYGLVSLCKSLISPFVLCSDLFYVLAVSLINVRNGSRRVFVVHLICDCCRACVVSCYIITHDLPHANHYTTDAVTGLYCYFIIKQVDINIHMQVISKLFITNPGNISMLMNDIKNVLYIQELTWIIANQYSRLFLKRVVRIKLDFYVFTTIGVSLPLLVDYL